MVDMLKDVVQHGTAYSSVWGAGFHIPSGGKTGTTNDGTDVWFVGYTPTVVAAVWFGYDAPRPIAASASGGRLAAPAWASFYLDGWLERDPSDWKPPAGMVSRTIDAFNGDLANQWCPVTQREWFRAGTEPTRTCTEHQAPLVERLAEFGRKLGEALKDLLKGR
jgi:membrane carboxypeptidase/penicillin-binding protein